MHPADEKRLRRERDLWNAARGDGPSIVGEEIGRNNAEMAKRKAARDEYIRKARAGYYRDVPESDRYPFRG